MIADIALFIVGAACGYYVEHGHGGVSKLLAKVKAKLTKVS